MDDCTLAVFIHFSNAVKSMHHGDTAPCHSHSEAFLFTHFKDNHNHPKKAHFKDNQKWFWWITTEIMSGNFWPKVLHTPVYLNLGPFRVSVNRRKSTKMKIFGWEIGAA